MWYRRTAIASVVMLGVAMGAPNVAPAQTSTDLITCQRRLERRARSYAKFLAYRLHNCANRVAACKHAQEIDSVDPTSCLADANTYCDTLPALAATRRADTVDAIMVPCGLLSLANMQQYLGGLGFGDVVTNQCPSLPTPPGAITPITVDDLVECLLRITECAAQREVQMRDPRANDSLTEVGQAASFPCVAED
jgi:hypothetical protein